MSVRYLCTTTEEDLVTNVGLLLVIVTGVMAVNANVLGDVDIDRTRREERIPIRHDRCDRRGHSLWEAAMVLYNIMFCGI